MIKLGHNLFSFSLGNILSQARVILCVCFKHVLPWSLHFVLSSGVTWKLQDTL